ncbi:hypothetical protein K431DRAFT_300103 [Polychaeton citri CBS 116435]|uniref:Uncharacterized protein n=1 Tax=Polychaeton citri CBS 116435 TaxID=1314669 RepID=A0A9P4UTX2_9PEZI|nr:hypothetical protein K431DRAFT_300103 [Polychaeton citri CBS 116435]
MSQFDNQFAEPIAAQANFAQQYNLERPEQAMSSYQKIMHEHTRQQFNVATASSRRRSAGNGNIATLSPSSSNSSVDSTAS